MFCAVDNLIQLLLEVPHFPMALMQSRQMRSKGKTAPFLRRIARDRLWLRSELLPGYGNLAHSEVRL
jgi:hypothetical protein